MREDRSLEKAIEIARSYEQIKHQMEKMKEKSVEALTENKRQNTKQPGWKNY